MCVYFQQKLQRLSDLARGQQVSKVAELSLYSCCESLHHRPTVRSHLSPNTSGRHCQGWHRRENHQQKQQRLSDLARGQQVSKRVELYMYRSCESFHHRPTVQIGPIPNTSGRRYQEWHKSSPSLILRQPFGLDRDQSVLMKGPYGRNSCFRRRPTFPYDRFPSISDLHCQERHKHCFLPCRQRRLSGPCQDRLGKKVVRSSEYSSSESPHHRPTVHLSPLPNT